MKRNHILFIHDIIDCIEKIESFIGKMNYQDFVEDDKTNSAVIRKLEIIGEATKNIPREIKQKHDKLPWSQMAKMRDKMIHSYFGVDYDIVWNVAKERLPQIKSELHRILQDWNT